jgi:hypothetical protein
LGFSPASSALLPCHPIDLGSRIQYYPQQSPRSTSS